MQRLKTIVLFNCILYIIACTPKPTNSNNNSTNKSETNPEAIQAKEQQIAEYIRNIIQDKNGNFWMGTNGYGVAHYNGDSLIYYSVDQGFGGQQITGIAEDPDENIWFATDQGAVKYSWASNEQGTKLFTNYSSQIYFHGDRLWSIFADSKGAVWAGTTNGIYRFDGMMWMPYKLPYPEGGTGEFITERTAWCIIEDSKGHLWFSSNGYGVYKYDGRSFKQYSKENGLTDNSVDVIMEDSKGNIWIGTRYGGVSKYDGESFSSYNVSSGSLGNDEVCALYEDSAGNIWMSSEGYGLYRYDGKRFHNYGEEQGLSVGAVQTIYEDNAGQLWTGGGGGLYRLEKDSFINVTQNGPWN